jgi:hypothetical protein
VGVSRGADKSLTGFHPLWDEILSQNLQAVADQGFHLKDPPLMRGSLIGGCAVLILSGQVSPKTAYSLTGWTGSKDLLFRAKRQVEERKTYLILVWPTNARLASPALLTQRRAVVIARYLGQEIISTQPSTCVQQCLLGRGGGIN